MKKIVLAAIALFFAGVANSTPILSRDSTIFILLSTVEGGGAATLQ